MPAIDFFESEIAKAQTRFNATFGVNDICWDIKTRQRVIMAIIKMGLLQRKISNAHDQNMVRQDIRNFVRARDVLKGVFNQAEQHIKNHQQKLRLIEEQNRERRNHDRKKAESDSKPGERGGVADAAGYGG